MTIILFIINHHKEWPEGCLDCEMAIVDVCCNFGNGIEYCTKMKNCPSSRQHAEITSKLD